MVDGPHGQEALSHDDRASGVRRVLWIVLVFNVGVAITKLVMGFAINSLSLIADGFHASLDGTSNIVGLVGMAFAAAPPDEAHPYGHKRFETFASFVIGLFIAAGFWEIVKQVYNRVTHPGPPPVVTWLNAGIIGITVIVNLGISLYETRRGRALQSAILLADAKHTMADTFGALAVLVSFGAIALGIPYADVAATSIVAILIAHTAYEVLAPNFRILVDAATLDPADIRKVALSVDGVRGTHKERSRGSLDHVHVDLHIQVDPSMSIEEAHALTHKVADAIRAAFPNVRDVLIHTEPGKADAARR